MVTKQTSCKQCGVCCIKGGATLHSVDIALLNNGLVPRKDLVTIRKGEFAYNPVTNCVQATKAEIVKLRGTGKEWICCYYDPKAQGCTIYDNRPMACGVLKCWDPEGSLALVERV
jgi:Fe-S-cluster containining protein